MYFSLSYAPCQLYYGQFLINTSKHVLPVIASKRDYEICCKSVLEVHHHNHCNYETYISNIKELIAKQTLTLDKVYMHVYNIYITY